MSNQSSLLGNQQSQKTSSFVRVESTDTVTEDPRKSYAKSLSQIYKMFPYRYIVFLSYLAAVMINGIPYETFVPISKDIGEIYGVTASEITLTATLYMLMHPAFTFIASIMIVKKGFGFSVKVGCFFTVLGYGCRLLINTSFVFVFLGQVLCGMGRPMILNSQASMAQNWFVLKQRTLILTITNMVQTVSIIVSLQIPGQLFNAKYDPDGTNEASRSLTFNLLLYEFIASALVIPIFFFLRTSAPTPPSAFANTDVAVPFKQTMRGIFANKSFILLFVANSMYFGILKGLGVVIPYLMSPFGFNSAEYSNTASMPIYGGFISSLFISTLVQKVGKYKPIAFVLMLLTLIFMVLFYPAISTGNAYVVYANGFLLGFFLIPLIPVLIEMSCENIYPLSGSFAVGMLLSGATLLTVVTSQVLTIITKGNDSDSDSSLLGCICIVALLLVGIVSLSFVKEVKNRTNEILQRKSKSTLFFKSTIVGIKGDSKIQQQNDILASIGEYPTYHPFVDQYQFISDPEQCNPDVIRQLHQSFHDPSA